MDDIVISLLMPITATEPGQEGVCNEDVFVARIAGLYQNRPFCVDVFVEYEGRDVDVENVWGVQVDEYDLFEKLLETPGFDELMNAEYAKVA